MDDNSDAYSLYTLEGNEEDRPLLAPSFDNPDDAETVDRSGIECSQGGRVADDDDDDIPAAFFESKVLIDGPPVFSWNQTYCWPYNILHKYSTWKYGPWHILVCFWTTLVGTQYLAMKFHADPDANETALHYQWGPAVLVTILLCVTRYVVSGHIHHLMQQPGESMYYSGSYQSQLWWAFASVATVAAPILCVSIFDYYVITEERTFSGPVTQCAKLSSWTGVLPNLHGNLPLLLETKVNRGPWTPGFASSDDLFVAGNETLRATMPDHISFSLPNSGKGSEENGWYGFKGSQVNGVFMPVIPITGAPKDKLTLSTSWQTQTQLLAFGLDCDYIPLQDQPQHWTIDGSTSLSIQATDTYGCSASMNLSRFQLDDETLDSIHRLLSLLERDAYGDGQGQVPHQAALRRIESYRKLLFRNGDLVSYEPTWARPSKHPETLEACRRRIFIAGVEKALLPSDTIPDKSLIQFASCQANLKVANTVLQLLRDDENSYLQQPDFTSSSFQVFLDDVKLAPGDHLSKLRNTNAWSSLSKADMVKFQEAFASATSSISIEHKNWDSMQLKEEIADAYWMRLKPVNALLTVSSHLGNTWMASLSLAAGLTMQEAFPQTGILGPTIEMQNFTAEEVLERKVERVTFQTRTFFRFWLILVAIPLTIQLFILQGECMERYEDNYRAPWDISSIATRAILLRFSRAKNWLSQVQSYVRTLDSPPRMLVGHWTADGTEAANGLRIDIPMANVSNPEPPNNYKGWKWENDSSYPRFMREGVEFLLAFPYAICQMFLFVYSLFIYIMASRNNYESRLLFLLLDDRNFHSKQSLWWFLFAVFIPAAVAFRVGFVVIPRVFDFFRHRQPWVSLKLQPPKLAHLGFTLDYWNHILPVVIWKALRNRHRQVATLGILTLIGCLLPPIYGRLYIAEWRSESLPVIDISQNLDWVDQSSFLRNDSRPFDLALKELPGSLSMYRKTHTWSSYRGALLPIGLDISSPIASYWRLNTSALRVSLDCAPTDLKIVVDPTPSSDYPHRVRSLTVPAESTSDHLKFRTKHPCSYSESMRSDRSSYSRDESVHEVACGSWSLHHNANKSPVWFITVLHGPGDRSKQSGEMLFNDSPQTLGLICRPTVEVDNVTVTLFSKDFRLSTAKPTKHKAFGSSNKLDWLSNELSSGLNASMHRLHSTNGSLDVNDHIIRTERFSGDVLSYMLYRYGYAANMSSLNATNVANDASLLFSSYLSVLLERTNLLQRNTTQLVSLQPIKLEEYLLLNRAALIAIPLLIISSIVVLVIIENSRAKFSLPFPPEPLLNGLLLLCHSSIVSTLELQLARPESMTLGQIYKEIERWGHKYKLGTLDGGKDVAEKLLAVDFNAVFEEEERRQRFEAVSETDSDGGSSEDNGPDGSPTD